MLNSHHSTNGKTEATSEDAGNGQLEKGEDPTGGQCQIEILRLPVVDTQNSPMLVPQMPVRERKCTKMKKEKIQVKVLKPDNNNADACHRVTCQVAHSHKDHLIC